MSRNSYSQIVVLCEATQRLCQQNVKCWPSNPQVADLDLAEEASNLVDGTNCLRTHSLVWCLLCTISRTLKDLQVGKSNPQTYQHDITRNLSCFAS